jgi:hypothetical protein
MPRHLRKFEIADAETVQVLVKKLVTGGVHQQRRERLLEALDVASKRYKATSQKQRQAFFHGLLTGYAVALKLW